MTVAEAAPRRTLGRVVLLVFLFGGVLTLLLCNALMIILELSEAGAILAASAAAILPALVYAGLIVLLDRYEREPRRTLLASFLWGALAATFVSAIANTLFQLVAEGIVGPEAAALLTASISAPLVEETMKGIALLLLYWFMRDEFDNVLDGIVYGALVGIGFAMTENILYLGRAYLEPGNVVALGPFVTSGEFALLFYVRVVLQGLAGHAAYTATTGAGLGYARETTQPLARIVVPIFGWIVAVTWHFLWNTFGAILVTLPLMMIEAPLLGIATASIISVLITGPATVTLLVLVVLAWRREARVIHDHLADEVQSGVITPAEYDRLCSTRQRLAAEWRALTTRGYAAWRALAALHQAATELAFRKWHLARGTIPRRAARDTTEDTYRQRIVDLRARL